MQALLFLQLQASRVELLCFSMQRFSIGINTTFKLQHLALFSLGLFLKAQHLGLFVFVRFSDRGQICI